MKNIRYLPSPIFVNIYLTNECNLRCKHCIDSSGILTEEEKSRELSNEEIYGLIDYYIDKGVSNFSFSGGEPLIHRNVFNFIKYIRERSTKKEIKITLLTNATLVDESVAKKLYDLGVNYVRTSIESCNPETHDWIRGKENFEKVIFGLKHLLKANIPEVGVTITVNKKNLNEIESTIEFLYNLGLRYITMAPLMPLGRGQNLKDLLLDIEDFKKLLEKKIAFEKQYPNVFFTLDSPLLVILVKDNPELLEKHGPCVIGTCFIGFKANGDIYACPIRDEVIIGNIRNDNLEDIWNNSPFLNQIRNLDLLEGKCKECEFKSYCGGGCRAHSHIKYNDVTYPDPYCWL